MPQPLKFLLLPLGSAGDVHPFIWLAKLLRAHGHDVTIICQSVVAEMPQAAHIPTRTWGNLEEQKTVLNNPDIWHPSKAFPLLMSFLPQWTRETLPVIRDELDRTPGVPTALLAGTLALGAKVASEKWGVPLISVHLQPSLFMSVERTPVVAAGFEFLPGSPRWVRRLILGLAVWNVDRVLRPLVKQVRREAGLPVGRLKGLMDQIWHSRDGELALFPDWYAPKAADWPAATVTTRFPLYDESQERPIDPALEAFLAAGTPPVVITPGTANTHAARFIQQSVAACHLTGHRALVVTRFPEQAGLLPDHATCFQYVPFGRVFPRAAAVIHHGGIGTMAQCLLAGVPHLIMPMAHDQPDNAARIKKMGVGDFLYPKKFTAPRIAQKLRTLTSDPATRQACADLRRKMQSQMSEDQMADLILSMATCK